MAVNTLERIVSKFVYGGSLRRLTHVLAVGSLDGSCALWIANFGTRYANPCSGGRGQDVTNFNRAARSLGDIDSTNFQNKIIVGFSGVYPPDKTVFARMSAVSISDFVPLRSIGNSDGPNIINQSRDMIEYKPEENAVAPAEICRLR